MKDDTINTKNMQIGRTRPLVDYGAIFDLWESKNLGWSRVVREYTKRTGQYISKQICKGRYEEIRFGNNTMATHGHKLKYSRSPPDSRYPASAVLPYC